MGELVGDTVGLEIGDVEAGAVNGPLFEITTDNFGVVIIVGFVCEKRKSCKEKDGEQKHRNRQTTDFHRTHLGAEDSDAERIDLYSGEGKWLFWRGKCNVRGGGTI